MSEIRSLSQNNYILATPLDTARNLDGNISTGNKQVFTWPKDGAPDSLHIKDYSNNEQFVVDSQGPLWWNDNSNTGVRLSKTDAQTYKKVSNPVNMNSFDNRGWETAGTITTGNPFGVGINFAAAYDNYSISDSRLVSQYLGNSLWNIDLYVCFTGTPKNNWYLYSDFLTIQSGHFSAPTNSYIKDQWNNSFGCLTKNTIYGTGLDYIAHEPHTPTNAQFINLHTLVAEW